MQENIDILPFLEQIVQTNTHSYQEDFQLDVKTLTAAIQAQDKEGQSCLWMSRPHGTWCLNEHSVFVRDSTEHSIWTYYADYASEANGIKAFRVTVTGQDKGRPTGNVYPIDYKKQVLRIIKNALPAETVILTFESGQTITFPFEQVKNRFGPIKDKYGTIEKIRYTVKDESELEAVMLAEHRQSDQETKQTAPSRRPAKRKNQSKTTAR